MIREPIIIKSAESQAAPANTSRKKHIPIPNTSAPTIPKQRLSIVPAICTRRSSFLSLSSLLSSRGIYLFLKCYKNDFLQHRCKNSDYRANKTDKQPCFQHNGRYFYGSRHRFSISVFKSFMESQRYIHTPLKSLKFVFSQYR